MGIHQKEEGKFGPSQRSTTKDKPITVIKKKGRSTSIKKLWSLSFRLINLWTNCLPLTPTSSTRSPNPSWSRRYQITLANYFGLSDLWCVGMSKWFNVRHSENSNGLRRMKIIDKEVLKSTSQSRLIMESLVSNQRPYSC